jgi:hypothetical protein
MGRFGFFKLILRRNRPAELYITGPDGHSGAPLSCNGNKGVDFPAIFSRCIYALFFYGILYWGDSDFSSSFSGVIALLIYI